MTIQFRASFRLVPVLILLVGTSAGARSLAAIDGSLARGKATWNAADSKQKQIDDRHLEEFEGRAPIERSGRSLFGRIKHYVSTHKELLATDAIVFAALSADAISSEHCIRVPILCYETSSLLPNYPSGLLYWGYFTGEEAIYVTAMHLWWHKHPDSPWRHVDWAGPIGVSIFEIYNVRDNYEIASGQSKRLQEARARVSR
ncbi:MAG TPA: hypothetical protein VN881_09505 [Candidatus Acidoferrales bacterium]|nr:hypothetical protein [Candidatus Acidoferrales bacterium]